MAASEKSPEDPPSVQRKAVAQPTTHNYNKSSSESRIHPSTDDDCSYTISAANGARSPLSAHVASGSNNHHLILKVETMESLISRMFSTVSSLKNAYLQLQSAHVPYDRLKIQIADKAIVQELRRMSELKRSYKENMAAIQTSTYSSSSSSNSSSSCLCQEDAGDAKARHHPGEMSKQKRGGEEDGDSNSNINPKGDSRSAAEAMKKERREQMEERRLKRSSIINGSSAWIQGRSALTSSSPTPELLEEVVLMASESSRSFAKVLISLMKAANWDMAAAAEAIEAGVRYGRRSHTKFALESYVNHRMLNGFEDAASFDGDGVSVSQSREQCFREFQELLLQDADDPLLRLEADPQGSFAAYCRNKFLDVVHPKMEESFFGDLSHRKQLMDQGTHPRSHLYRNFLSLAKSMWMMHKLAFSFHPPARIFAAERGVDFTPLYMESIVQSMDVRSRAGAKVAFTVMPGFRVQKTIIKCQVYVHKAYISESGGGDR